MAGIDDDPVSTSRASQRSSQHKSRTKTTSRSPRSHKPMTLNTRASAVPTNTISSAASGLHTGGPGYTDAISHSGLSKDSKRAIIATAAVCGFLLLAAIFFALWRRRKGIANSRVFNRQPSNSNIPGPRTRDPGLTALPLFEESGHSPVSPKYKPMHGHADSIDRPPTSASSPLAARIYRQDPYMNDMWKSFIPTTPNHQSLPEASRVPSPFLRPPEMVKVHDAQSRNSLISSYNTNKSDKAITVRSASPMVGEAGSRPPSPTTKQALQEERWSWTNSDAPSTPRMYARSVSSSVSSLPKFRNVKAWVRTQSKRRPSLIEEERPTTSERKAIATIDSKPAKPTSTSRPTRKLSKRQLRRKNSQTTEDGDLTSPSAIAAPGSALLRP